MLLLSRELSKLVRGLFFLKPAAYLGSRFRNHSRFPGYSEDSRGIYSVSGPNQMAAGMSLVSLRFNVL